jgi:NAD(P)-dependent dehydrogenase (short-subunit alcohol dehydrogenase family)
VTRLQNKTAIVTGAAGSIGLATSTCFAKKGANVVLVDINEQSLQEAVDSIESEKVSYFVADVTRSDQVKGYVHHTIERYGGVDVFVNNAGIEGEVKSIPEYSIAVFDQVIAVNIRGLWLGLKYVIPEMKNQKNGSIILTSSVGGIKGTPGISAYSASKHAAIGLMRTAALECAESNIRVNTVNPSPIEGRMIRSIEKQSGASDIAHEQQDRMQRIPLKRYGTPDEVANLMLFLASDESQYCTGGVYMVDGGASAN